MVHKLLSFVESLAIYVVHNW